MLCPLDHRARPPCSCEARGVLQTHFCGGCLRSSPRHPPNSSQTPLRLKQTMRTKVKTVRDNTWLSLLSENAPELVQKLTIIATAPTGC